MQRRETPLKGFWGQPLQDLLKLLEASPAGLTTDEAKRPIAPLAQTAWCGNRDEQF